MRTLVLFICLGFVGWNFAARALEKASDFKEVGISEESTDEEATAPQKENVKAVSKENEKVLSGTVRVVRKIGSTEIFFKDLNESYFIPSGRNYSSIYKACEESQKKGTKVSFRANTKSRQILSLEDAPAERANTSSVNTSGSEAKKTGDGSK